MGKNCVEYAEHFMGVLSITAKEIGKRGQDFPEPMGDNIAKNRAFYRAGPAWNIQVTWMDTFYITPTINNLHFM
jgi:hypothetical protein